VCKQCHKNPATLLPTHTHTQSGYVDPQTLTLDHHTDLTPDEKKFVKARVELEQVLNRHRPDSEVAQELVELQIEYGETREEWGQEKGEFV
jgi:hypothetical protein